jgi:hypothetical protein
MSRKFAVIALACGLVAPGLAAGQEDDAIPGVPFQPGDKIEFDQLEKIKDYLPAPYWEYREFFFFEGQNMEIGEFYKDYPVSEERKLADEKFGGQARIGRDNSLENHVMGTPFHDIDPSDPQAGVKHAWNFQYKQDALEGRASFYFTYWDNGDRLPLWFEGKGWGLRLANRPDHMETNGDIFKKEKRNGAGGVRVESPPDYRGIMLLGYRYKAIDKPRDESRETDVWVYIPDLRRVRRISGSRRTDPVAGTDMVAEDQGGFNGVVTHFEWEYIGEQDVLAPIDTRLRGYPFSKDENFGPFGYSYANDIWQLRKTIVVEQKPKDDHIYTRKRLWFDKDTYQTLYAAAYDRRDELWKVIHPIYHWSERDDLPTRVKDKDVNALLPSCFVLVNVVTGTGVRVEVFDAHATRMKRGRLRKQIDIGRLSRQGR